MFTFLGLQAPEMDSNERCRYIWTGDRQLPGELERTAPAATSSRVSTTSIIEHATQIPTFIESSINDHMLQRRKQPIYTDWCHHGGWPGPPNALEVGVNGLSNALEGAPYLET